jgi:cobaltochelatase CobS
VADVIGHRILGELRAKVQALALLADKPPVETIREVKIDVPRDVIVTKEVQVETIRTVAVPVDQSIIDQMSGRPLPQMTGHKSTSELFGTRTGGVKLDVSTWSGTAPDGVPAVDPDYVWVPEMLAYLAIHAKESDASTAKRHATRSLFCGPAGTGKTTAAEQFAAATGRPYVRVPAHRQMELGELIGQRYPHNGTTVFRPGALVAAMQVPGTVILLDEPSILPPGTAAILQTILDTGVVYLREDGNRVVTMAPGVMVIAADNTNLAGDQTGRYAGTMAQNIALQDRFAFIVAVDYLPADREARVLVSRTGIPQEAAKAMVHFATTSRTQAGQGQITTGTSLRRLMAWANGVMAGLKSEQAFKTAILNPCDATDLETIRGLASNVVNHAAIDATMNPVA